MAGSLAVTEDGLVDRPSADSELSADSSITHPLSRAFQDLSILLRGCDFGRSRPAPLGCHIGPVFGLGAKPPVCRVMTPADVTGMADAQSVGPLSMSDEPSDLESRHGSTLGSHRPVAGGSSSSIPRPAFIGTELCDFSQVVSSQVTADEKPFGFGVSACVPVGVMPLTPATTERRAVAIIDRTDIDSSHVGSLQHDITEGCD